MRGSRSSDGRRSPGQARVMSLAPSPRRPTTMPVPFRGSTHRNESLNTSWNVAMIAVAS